MNITIDSIGGNCPVQAEGHINGKPFYFRARGEHWSMSVGGDDVIGKPEWFYEEEYPGGQFAAGWMDKAEAIGFLHQAAEKYCSETTP